MTASPWAILLCKFNDDDREPYPRSRYEELFTRSGVGRYGMVDYFTDMSHGNLDLTGSEVFGWWTLDHPRSEYLGNETLPYGRNTIIDWGRAKAAAEGVDLSSFYCVVVCLNVNTDVFGSPAGVCCDDGRWNSLLTGFSTMSPCVLGQEMGHGYGLNHSRIEGGGEYTDPWDIMSTTNTIFMAPHPYFTDLDEVGRPIFRIGPALNAANMAYKEWLDMTRVWVAPSNADVQTEIVLRPLHRRDLPGYLAAQVGELFIEFRMNEGWDAAIGQPCVLVHRLEGGISYLQSGNRGAPALTEGDWFGIPPEASMFWGGFRAQVVSIDASDRTARIALVRAKPPKRPLEWPDPRPFRDPGIAWSDAATLIIGDRQLTIPARSQSYKLLEQIAVLENSRTIYSATLQRSVEEYSLSKVSELAGQGLSKLREPSVLPRQLLSTKPKRSVARKEQKAGPGSKPG